MLALILLQCRFVPAFVRATGTSSSIDIPTAYCLEHSQIAFNCTFSGGSKEPAFEDKYRSYTFKLAGGLFNFLEIGLNYYTGYQDVVTGYVHFQLIQPKDKRIGLGFGIQNIYGEEHISFEGKSPEFDHLYHWEKGGEEYSWTDDQSEANSAYIVSSMQLAPAFHFHLGLGNSRFVGHSGWSEIQSFDHSPIAFFWGLDYTFKLREHYRNSVTVCLEGDGRDGNFSRWEPFLI